jgi:hypothetical protein
LFKSRQAPAVRSAFGGSPGGLTTFAEADLQVGLAAPLLTVALDKLLGVVVEADLHVGLAHRRGSVRTRRRRTASRPRHCLASKVELT